MAKTVKTLVLNDALHWFWKLAPFIFVAGVVWNKVDNLETRVVRIENFLMPATKGD